MGGGELNRENNSYRLRIYRKDVFVLCIRMYINRVGYRRGLPFEGSLS